MKRAFSVCRMKPQVAGLDNPATSSPPRCPSGVGPSTRLVEMSSGAADPGAGAPGCDGGGGPSLALRRGSPRDSVCPRCRSIGRPPEMARCSAGLQRRPDSRTGPSGSPPHRRVRPCSAAAAGASVRLPRPARTEILVTGRSSRSSRASATAPRRCWRSSRHPAPRRNVSANAPRTVPTDRSPFPLSEPSRTRHESISTPEVGAKISQNRFNTAVPPAPDAPPSDWGGAPRAAHPGSARLEQRQVNGMPRQLALI